MLIAFNNAIEENGYTIALMEELNTPLLRKKILETKRSKIKILAQANAGSPTHIAEEDLLGYVILSEDKNRSKNYQKYLDKIKKENYKEIKMIGFAFYNSEKEKQIEKFDNQMECFLNNNKKEKEGHTKFMIRIVRKIN